jgi:hypothetical protein
MPAAMGWLGEAPARRTAAGSHPPPGLGGHAPRPVGIGHCRRLVAKERLFRVENPNR